MTIINMTPHSINVVSPTGEAINTYTPSGSLIRLKMETVAGEPLPDGTPTSTTVYGEPVGLPPAESGTAYIVSGLVKAAVPGRNDLFVPAEMVRNESGQIIGCQSLGR